MCSVFGFIADGPKRKVDLRTIERIVRANVKRGPHAWGIAWVDGAGRLHAFKQPGSLIDELPMLDMARDARAMIGHMRWATQGDPGDNVNNHPHPTDGGWLVHNGTVFNVPYLCAKHDLYPTSGCDSEVLGMLAEYAPAKAERAVDRAVWATEQVDGPVVSLTLHARPARLIAVRSGRPLTWARRPEGTYLATLGGAFAAPVACRENAAVELTIGGGGLDRDVRRKVRTSLFDEESDPRAYRGG